MIILKKIYIILLIVIENHNDTSDATPGGGPEGGGGDAIMSLSSPSVWKNLRGTGGTSYGCTRRRRREHTKAETRMDEEDEKWKVQLHPSKARGSSQDTNMSRRIQGIPTARMRGDERGREPATNVTGEQRSALLHRRTRALGQFTGHKHARANPRDSHCPSERSREEQRSRHTRGRRARSAHLLRGSAPET